MPLWSEETLKITLCPDKSDPQKYTAKIQQKIVHFVRYFRHAHFRETLDNVNDINM